LGVNLNFVVSGFVLFPPNLMPEFMPLALLGQARYLIYLVHAFILRYFGTSFDFTISLSAASYFPSRFPCFHDLVCNR
jgi:hypothetical protein